MIRNLSIVLAAAILAAVSFYAFGQSAPGYFKPNTFYAGPPSGSTAAYPAPRALVNADVAGLSFPLTSPANTIKGNNTGSTGPTLDLTVTQTLSLLGLLGVTGVTYSQGTWTPTMLGTTTAGSPTYATQTGTYEAIGRQIVVRFNVVVSTFGGPTGTMLIGGLPFPSGGTGTDFGACVLNYVSGVSLDTGYTQFSADIQPSTSTITLQEIGSGVSGNNLAVTKFVAPVQLIGMCNYHT